MYSKVKSAAIFGMQAFIVDVETDVGFGLPTFEMSGLLATEIKEARERIRVAIKNTGVSLKPQRVLVNISPADIRKDGTGFDLPIAIGILSANELIERGTLENVMIVGELSLDGRVNTVKGLLPLVCEAKDKGFTHCIVPFENAIECAVVTGIEVYGVKTLKQTLDFLSGKIILSPVEIDKQIKKYTSDLDFSDVKGQLIAKRATLVAAAGMHNLMYVGPPGSGKTMLAKRISGILPSMTFEESMELTKIYSIAGMLPADTPFLTDRQFRNPHHTVTTTALLGGGRLPAPGEVTLANGGVLFMDEMTEYNPAVLESLRQPIEDKEIKIVRVNAAFTYPADFMLVGAINPCKCGYYPDRNRCNCSEHDIKRFIGKISKPIWDRFDICVGTNAVKYEELNGDNSGNEYNSKGMKEMVERARQIQMKRFSGTNINFNSQMDVRQVKKFCKLGNQEEKLINAAFVKMGLTARSYHKVLKVARTIADIEGENNILERHICEAASYKNLGGER